MLGLVLSKPRKENLMQKPFENIVVLDLSRYLLGAYTSLFFGDLGARVIKVEDRLATLFAAKSRK